MRLIVFLMFVLQITACNTYQKQDVYMYELPEVTIYGKRIANKVADQQAVRMNQVQQENAATSALRP